MLKNNSVQFSVNLNKIALLRNARGNNIPNIGDAAVIAINAGCGGITLHPRKDKRHAIIEDIEVISELSLVQENNIEINVEGDLREDLIIAVQKYNVHQFTIVPVRAGERTTERGWSKEDDISLLTRAIKILKNKLRIAIFIEPNIEDVRYVASLGVDAVEFHTKWYAAAFNSANQAAELLRVKQASEAARELDVRVNLGHDLNLQNLPEIISAVQPDEVSIGHALITDSLNYGLGHVVAEYNQRIQGSC